MRAYKRRTSASGQREVSVEMDDFGRLQDEVALELLRGSHGQHRLLHQGGHGRHRHHRPVVEHEPVLRAEGAAAAPVDCESIPPEHTRFTSRSHQHFRGQQHSPPFMANISMPYISKSLKY
jgi:hypothetical protein